MRGALVRRGRHACGHRGGRAHWPARAAPAQAVRHEAALSGPPSPAGSGGARAEPDPPHQPGKPDPGLRRGHAELSAAPGNRAYDQCGVARQVQARRLPDQYRARQAVRSRRDRCGPRERPACRLRGRCLVPAAGAGRPSVAPYAASRHDPAYLGHQPVGPDALRGGHARNPGMLFRGPPDPR
ncbi:hypothetical protein D3C72_1362430 [compost metagenome]